MSMNRSLVGALLWLLLLTAAPPALAVDCHVSGAFGMNFGAVNYGGRASSSALNFSCPPDYSGSNATLYYQLCMFIGPGDQSVGQSTRRMTNNHDAYLKYDLFSDAAHTQLIGAPGSTPVHRAYLSVPPGKFMSAQTVIYGWVYPRQSVPAAHDFQEEALHGKLRWRYSNQAFPNSPDCLSGGSGGGAVNFESSGVYARFDNSCWISSTDLMFGSIPAPLVAQHERARLTIQCPANTAWRVGLDNGQHFASGMRRMAGASGHVAYQLYLDEAHTKVWGDDMASMATGVTDSVGNAQSRTVYGKISPQPQAAVGSYSDTVVVTLYY